MTAAVANLFVLRSSRAQILVSAALLVLWEKAASSAGLTPASLALASLTRAALASFGHADLHAHGVPDVGGPVQPIERAGRRRADP